MIMEGTLSPHTKFLLLATYSVRAVSSWNTLLLNFNLYNCTNLQVQANPPYYGHNRMHKFVYMSVQACSETKLYTPFTYDKFAHVQYA